MLLIHVQLEVVTFSSHSFELGGRSMCRCVSESDACSPWSLKMCVGMPEAQLNMLV